MRQWISAHCACLKIYVTVTHLSIELESASNSSFFLKNFLMFMYCVIYLFHMHMYAIEYIKVKGQLTRVASLLPRGLQVQTHLAVLAASTFTH